MGHFVAEATKELLQGTVVHLKDSLGKHRFDRKIAVSDRNLSLMEMVRYDQLDRCAEQPSGEALPL
jgi:hypothetical protein